MPNTAYRTSPATLPMTLTHRSVPITAVLTALMASAVAAEDIKSLTALAGKGDAEAQLSLAIHYRDGIGVPKDGALAMQWGHRAADRGNIAAMDFVGHAYLRGTMVRRQPEIAFGYFKAAAGKSSQAAYNLAQCYFGAQGTEQDVAKAIEWWTKAAAGGHARAASTAAMALLSGEGIQADPVEARRLAERAAELNDPAGLVLLGELQYQAGEIEAAKASWTKVAKLHATGPTSQPEQPSGTISPQQGADLLKLLPFRERKPEPGKFAWVQMPHILQGYNNCGATSCAIFARAQGHRIGGWDFKRLCPSPLGTGTDWADLLEASKKIGLDWKLVTFADDDAGFDEATTFLKHELDAGRPVVIDFKFIGPQYPNGEAGHTLTVAGYLADEDLYILCNPAITTPGIQLITAADLKKYWRSNYYSHLAKRVMSRPALAINSPTEKREKAADRE